MPAALRKAMIENNNYRGNENILWRWHLNFVINRYTVRNNT